MPARVYIYGCSCGITAHYIMRVRSKVRGITVYNSKRDSTALELHIEYLKQAGINIGSFQSIVVQDDKTVTLLKEWK